MTAIPRFHLFEIHDQPWCPRGVRDAVTDLLQWTFAAARLYDPVVPALARALRRTASPTVVDLGSGAGGPWAGLMAGLAAAGVAPELVLTDKYPNRPALERARARLGVRVRVHAEPVDALAAPAALTGFRTLFTTFHHFRPDAARQILADAARRADGIAVCEAAHRSPAALVAMLGFVFVLLVVPFIRPFRWDRLFWTYVIPLVPLVAVWDGLVSCLRTYTPAELRALAGGLDAWEWEAAEAGGAWWRPPVTYLIGYPKDTRGDTLPA